MASGDTIDRFHPLEGMPPTSNYATRDERNGHNVLDFDAGTDESVIFESPAMPANYSGSTGIDVIITGTFSAATSGAALMEASFEKVAGQDIDSDGFASAKTGSITANGTSGVPSSCTISFSAAEADSIAAGNPYRLKISRDANGTNGTDDATGDFELLGVELKDR